MWHTSRGWGLVGKSAHRTRQEEEEIVLGHLCKDIRWEQVMDFGRWKRFLSCVKCRQRLFKGLIGPGPSSFTDSEVSKSGRRMQCAPFPVTSSGIWDSTSSNVPGIKSPQTNRDNIAELWSRDWYQRSKSLSPGDESSEQFIPTFSPPFKYQVQLQQQQHKRLRHSRCCKDRENTTGRNGIHRWYKAGRVLQIPQRTKK